MRVLLVLLLLGLAACAEPAGSGADATPSPTATTGDAAPADDDLLIELDRGDGTAPERYTLDCGDVPDGDHPDAAAACTHLAGIEEPFAPLAADVACTEQYGGPETARITGLWHGEPVEIELSRTDGCRIHQWDSLGPVLPPVEGAVPN
jgi:Subtilisin inhibitor-like